MITELVRIPTIDGLLLDGALLRPEKPAAERRAWVLVHGTGGNFTSPGLLQGLTTLFADRGEAVLRLNTRGHDLMARIPTMQGTMPGGAAYEKLEEAASDLMAACLFLQEEGFDRISLLGHSLGGVKIVLAQSHSPLPRVDELVAVSPPRLNHDTLIESDVFRDDYLKAAQLVATGHGQELVSMREPLTLVMTAEGVLQKYGPQNKFDVVAHLQKVHQPTLVIIDARSPVSSPAFAGLPEAIREISGAHPAIELHSHPGDIHYRNGEVSVANLIAEWRARRQREMDVSI